MFLIYWFFEGVDCYECPYVSYPMQRRAAATAHFAVIAAVRSCLTVRHEVGPQSSLW